MAREALLRRGKIEPPRSQRVLFRRSATAEQDARRFA
eukprot:CAMPEP_0198647640 /NCGR_PEP_ID=MMETSP1467-20131203/2881_1 /TAXON_ID=1462469 /ORGANISM="unid. sp., Strain CCMP2135" /LENGTH=36 /DNA_ID= /DNA_START= /DNA_END= /DNA_ORIENTATION=